MYELRVTWNGLTEESVRDIFNMSAVHALYESLVGVSQITFSENGTSITRHVIFENEVDALAAFQAHGANEAIADIDEVWFISPATRLVLLGLVTAGTVSRTVEVIPVLP
jgi:hypothetical protein